ncbi:MAG: TetR/AcrR family transcriptional regulator [Paracoccaceae bacterium]
MKDQFDIDPKQMAILMSAWEAFAAYGFRKTSMDDIARGAGISRPALYLHYKNKEDIFRSLTRHYYEQATQSFAEALDRPGAIGEVLGEAYLAKGGESAVAMLTSPHGHELLDVKLTNASEEVEAGEAGLAEVLAEWLDAQAARGRVTLPGPAREVARVCLSTFKGLMKTAESHEGFVRDVRLMSALLGDGLTAR